MRNELAPEHLVKNTYEDWLEILKESNDSIIISDGFALQKGLRIGDVIQLEYVYMVGGYTSTQLIVKGIIHSLPGYGLASEIYNNSIGTKEYALVNEYMAFSKFFIEDVNLFLAKTEEKKPIGQIEEEIMLLNNILTINRITKDVNEDNIIANNIPKISIFLTIQIIILTLITGVVVSAQLGECLTRRKPTNALLMSLGMSLKDFFTISNFELLLMILVTVIGGFVLGGIFSFITIKTTVAFLTNYVIIPLKLTFNVSWMIVYALLIIGLVYLTSIQKIYKVNRSKALTSISELVMNKSEGLCGNNNWQ